MLPSLLPVPATLETQTLLTTAPTAKARYIGSTPGTLGNPPSFDSPAPNASLEVMFCAVSRLFSAEALPGDVALNAAAKAWIDVTGAPLRNWKPVKVSWMGLKPACRLRFHRMAWADDSRDQPGLLVGPRERSNGLPPLCCGSFEST
ncbi:hypothetical protein D9M72_498620 [compost metagenome]